MATEQPGQAERLDTWAVVELFGHTRIAGKLTEHTIAGSAFLRVDVPECEGTSPFTRFYGGGAIYSISPCSEEAARVVARRLHAEPITVYVPEFRALPGATMAVVDEDDDSGDEPWHS